MVDKTFYIAILIFIMALSLFGCDPQNQQSDMGIFEHHSDIGTVKIHGTMDYNANRGEYVIGGSGQNMWNATDDFHFVWKKMKGNFILDTRFKFLGTGTDPHRKAGWMVRQDTTTNSSYADAVVHGDGLTSLQFRRIRDGETEEIQFEARRPDIIRFERNNNRFIMSVAKEGDPFSETAALKLDLGDEVYVGLFVCSHNADVLENAVFSNVRITIPIHDDFRPYEEYIGSRVEVLDMETLNRTVAVESSQPLEAPNWTNQMNTIIYNTNGLLYSLRLDTKDTRLINTGSANQNNNDHVLSPDGKIIGISNYVPEYSERYNSRIYLVPVEGGDPVLVTRNSPSYLHGWSPDGLYLIYTAERNGNYDIYKIPVQGGDEVRLTEAEGLDDGSEYSFDGKHIYFNSSRTGTMQIYRMNPDGSHQEQLTFDEYNDWFPHPSPDGKWMIFLSYPREVEADHHPYYKKVMLRVMPLSGGKPKVVAYLYGGQGTLNVPPWSPDSKRVVFISNSIISSSSNLN